MGNWCGCWQWDLGVYTWHTIVSIHIRIYMWYIIWWVYDGWYPLVITHGSPMKASSPISWSNAAERAGPCARPLLTPLTRLIYIYMFYWRFGKQWIERCTGYCFQKAHQRILWHFLHVSMLVLCANQLAHWMSRWDQELERGNMKWNKYHWIRHQQKVWHQIYIYIFIYAYIIYTYIYNYICIYLYYIYSY